MLSVQRKECGFMEKFQKQIAEGINSLHPEFNLIFTIPPDSSFGDISLPCFSFAKLLRKSPTAIAEEWKAQMQGLEFLDRVETKNGFLNFFIKKPVLFEEILTEIRCKGNKYGSSGTGEGKRALVEHTSINPNASPHVGRARNALIGDCIVKLLRFEGYTTDVHYFVNDIGKQIAMLLLGAMDKPDVTFNDLLGIYIDINSRLEADPSLETQVFELLYKLENNDAQIRTAFRHLVGICISGQTAILSELGIQYDAFDYESDYIYSNTTGKLLEDFQKSGRLEEDNEGRLVLNQEEHNLPTKAPYLVLTRKDKTSLYPLRDIAYTIDKIKSKADINIIVLGEDQKLYFRQICAALALLGHPSPSVVHYSFVLLAEGKMATRKGNVVLLEDFMKEAAAKAARQIAQRHDSVDECKAKAIGYGAVKYAILRASNEKNVIFDWDTALSFEGDSGPYLQYSLVRINSILRKYGKALPPTINWQVFSENTELDLAKELANFPGVVKIALVELSPHVIANYVYGLAKKFSTFYHDCPVLQADNEELTAARIALITCVQQVIRNCFTLLGIEPVDEM
jgi:arginyl-tRNA synthetase